MLAVGRGGWLLMGVAQVAPDGLIALAMLKMDL